MHILTGTAYSLYRVILIIALRIMTFHSCLHSKNNLKTNHAYKLINLLTLNRPGFLESSTAGGGADSAPPV